MDRVFTKVWRFDVDGVDVEVENRWNLVGRTRERLFVDGELVAQNRSWWRSRGRLTAYARGASGRRRIIAELTAGVWRVRCDLAVDPAPGPWGERAA